MAAELAPELRSSVAPASGTHPVRRSAARVWSGLWPKLGAVVLVVVIWQLVVWSGWRSQAALPGPWSVMGRLAGDLSQLDFYAGVALTLRRAALGYAIAAVAAIVVAILIARIELARRSVGALMVGLQSMPSIAWLPFAILLLQRSESAITLVVVMVAAPATAAGSLSGIDHVHPLPIRVGRPM